MPLPSIQSSSREAATADHMGQTRVVAQPLHRGLGKAGVDGHEVDPILSVHPDHVKEVVDGDFRDFALP